MSHRVLIAEDRQSTPSAEEVFAPQVQAANGTARLWGTRGSTPVSEAAFVRHGGNTSCMEIDTGTERLILDHCGYASGGKLRPQQNTVAPVLELASYSNVYAKLTFIGLASEEEFPFRDVHWMVRQVVHAFGPERCMWGSNFPSPCASRA